ncbi:gephyrin-like molybdotransferase Glp [Primorskyibacter sp. S187A]|uniref:molybdopterin-binding protein n=1 Tax=Primorskyibacter sp. S187A TaxID=3415130 RepID=UPI003C7A18AD
MIKPPPLRNDCFALPPGVTWTPVDEALDLLRARLHTVVSATSGPLNAALGRVLAEDAIAVRSNPPHPNSAVDGYGFLGGIPDGETRIMPLCEGRAAAGVPFDGKVPQGSALRILTGAPIPGGVDTVVLEEDVTREGNEIALRGPLKQGANTRKAGEDVRAGEVALKQGTKIGAPEIALLSAVGVQDVITFAPLRVAIVSTGDELVDAGQAAAPGQIGDANRPMLSAIVKSWGYEVVDLGIQPDDPATIRAALDRGAREADVILTSGGASAGDEDHISALLRESGHMQSWRIAIKPGRPLALALWNDVPVFGLPGNPVAAMVCTLVFARPALASLSGMQWQAPQGFQVPANFTKSKKPGRREFLRARIRDGAVDVFKSEGSGRISGLAWADGLAELPDGALEVQPGARVTYYPWGSFGL